MLVELNFDEEIKVLQKDEQDLQQQIAQIKRQEDLMTIEIFKRRGAIMYLEGLKQKQEKLINTQIDGTSK